MRWLPLGGDLHFGARDLPALWEILSGTGFRVEGLTYVGFRVQSSYTFKPEALSPKPDLLSIPHVPPGTTISSVKPT